MAVISKMWSARAMSHRVDVHIPNTNYLRDFELEITKIVYLWERNMSTKYR